MDKLHICFCKEYQEVYLGECQEVYLGEYQEVHRLEEFQRLVDIHQQQKLLNMVRFIICGTVTKKTN